MNKWSRFYLPRGHPYLCPWNRTRASCHATTSSWHDLRGTGTSKTKWRLKATEKKRIIWPFLPSKWVKFSVLLIWLIYFLLIRVDPSPISFYFCFSYSIRVGPSQSELIRPGLAVRVDPVRLLYLPLVEGKKFGLICFPNLLWSRAIMALKCDRRW